VAQAAASRALKAMAIAESLKFVYSPMQAAKRTNPL
jgi:hypothetical protein